MAIQQHKQTLIVVVLRSRIMSHLDCVHFYRDRRLSSVECRVPQPIISLCRYLHVVLEPEKLSDHESSDTERQIPPSMM
jgi:hypothetical protein